MNVNRQAARSASTRAKLIKAARALFARHGYAGVATEEIARRAGVTRGALYHQFPAKEDLFLAVYEQVEQELTEGVDRRLGEVTSPFAALRDGVRVFLEACRAPEVQRIVLLDGPAVLGWERWREVAERYGLGLMEAVIAAAVEAGELKPVAVAPLAHLLMGALDEAALLIARDPEAVETVPATFELLLEGLRTPRGRGPRRGTAGRAPRGRASGEQD
ncbi:MAG TPA: TetR/AcrR family transcriptional regulator [Solirubrobacteraceae bacterium]|jgi:AcrR family transcriptional regulator|nr:TetR/AcrR family transcriptional regulator [Solirubrobacteraceae bacterium]